MTSAPGRDSFTTKAVRLKRTSLCPSWDQNAPFWSPSPTEDKNIRLMAENEILSFECPRDFTNGTSQCKSSSTIPSMRWDDDTIRDFASQFVSDEVYGMARPSQRDR